MLCSRRISIGPRSTRTDRGCGSSPAYGPPAEFRSVCTAQGRVLVLTGVVGFAEEQIRFSVRDNAGGADPRTTLGSTIPDRGGDRMAGDPKRCCRERIALIPPGSFAVSDSKGASNPGQRSNPLTNEKLAMLGPWSSSSLLESGSATTKGCDGNQADTDQECTFRLWEVINEHADVNAVHSLALHTECEFEHGPRNIEH